MVNLTPVVFVTDRPVKGSKAGVVFIATKLRITVFRMGSIGSPHRLCQRSLFGARR